MSVEQQVPYRRLIVERQGPVGWIINNRPDRLNAYDAVMREEFPRAWAELDADPDVRVIVHTGNGRAFQVGADVEELDGEAVLQFQETMRTLDLKLTGWHCNVGKPVITAVNGVCAGGGLALGLRCRRRDRRIGCDVRRPARVDRSGQRLGDHRADAQDACRSCVADGTRRQPRTAHCPARVRTRDDQPGRRPARETP